MISHIEKGKQVLLAEHLYSAEVHCKCHYSHCTQTLIANSAVRSFWGVRKSYDEPVRVNSGFRCQMHNKDVGGVEHSYHKLGLALDLEADDLDRLEWAARMYFDVVIRYETFVHCHNYN